MSLLIMVKQFIKDLLEVGKKQTFDMRYNLAGKLKEEYKFEEEDQRWFNKCLKDYNGQYYRISENATDDIKFAKLLRDKLPLYKGSYTKKKQNPGFTNNNTDILKHAEVIIWNTETLQKIFEFNLNSDKIQFVRGKGRLQRETSTGEEMKIREERRKSIKKVPRTILLF